MTLYEFSFNLCNSNKIKILATNDELMFEDDDELYEKIKTNKTLGECHITWFSVEPDGTLIVRVKECI